ncbi:uncharacterized protein LOC112503634 [Cynara cardunculus var. scolymus]|uniref:uncharacterized protein LOC112503634 n=1 Tax=Cynara cardunculus var. scolymus TaxID=59895 RepID=UPI000D6283C9|nr:uncharacterized protein LOC112503634 [Cynara cardunculus var. scolymus]
MEDCFMLTLIKQTEHKRRIRKEVPTMSEKFSDQEELPFLKLIRISMTDPYATDSSEDKDDHIFERWHVKKYVNEINIQPSSKARMMPLKGNMTTTRNSPCAIDSKQKAMKKKNKKNPEDNVRKFRGVRKGHWGRWAAEIMDPATRQRLWLGTYDTPEEAAMVYDNATIKLRGARAITNFVLPTCNQASSIKYMFKYINKGPDRATVAIVENSDDVVTVNVVDKIKQYYDCRYLSACEASWRIFGYDVHYRTPSVLRLPFHLPGQQQVVFGAEDNIDNVLNRPSVASSIDACYAHGLLDDDKEYIETIEEANLTASGFYLRFLFATMLISNNLSRPEFVWEKPWQYLADGIMYNQRIALQSPALNEEQMKNLTLLDIEKILLRNNSTLKNFTTLPYPDNDSLESSNNRLIAEELDYNHHNLGDEFHTLVTALTDEQRGVYDEIMIADEKKKGGVFFVYGHGGTGKTFLWKTLATSIRSKGEIVLNVASSGIASLLLTGGRTAHSRFHIPLILNEDSLCQMKPDSDVAGLIKKTTLIIWDEAPMVHKHAFEALDRSMNDIFNAQCSGDSNMIFGDKVIVLGGDFRQILSVIPNAGRQDIVNASLSSSYIWEKCKVLRLTRNMRLTANSESSEIEQTRDFAKWILDLGEGKVGGDNDGEAVIEIPHDLLITDCIDPISALIEFVYPSILENINNLAYFQERAILAPKNEVVQEINDCLLSLFPGEEKEYLSSDTLCESEHLHDEFDKTLYSPDVLNGLKL